MMKAKPAATPGHVPPDRDKVVVRLLARETVHCPALPAASPRTPEKPGEAEEQPAPAPEEEARELEWNRGWRGFGIND